MGQDNFRRQCDQFRRVSAYVLGFAAAPTGVDPYIAADDPTRLHECLLEGSDPSLKVRIVRSGRQQHADAPHALALLGVRRERPHGRTANERDEVAPLHSITSSARASSVGGISSPSAFAVLRFITNSNFVGSWIGRSPGFSPLSMRAA